METFFIKLIGITAGIALYQLGKALVLKHLNRRKP
jgi:hypothetical protein